MRTIKVITVVGARPQFVKVAAVSRAFQTYNQNYADVRFEEQIIHTGQHYDDNMSKIFFDELKIPRPAVNLDVGSGGHGWQTGAMLQKLEEILLKSQPNWVLIYGDTNSTLAGALAAVKLHIPVAHVEAGLRSFNRRMPEEINRVVADHVSTLLFCPTEMAVKNLIHEGVEKGVHLVGDVMYDSVLFNTALAESGSMILERLDLKPKAFYLATVHRAENTDDPKRLAAIIDSFSKINRPIVWPIHPRTRKILVDKFKSITENIRIIDPVSYLDMLKLEKNARIILTDSGGVQKEAYWFEVPCVTLRDETEWVELVEIGYNQLAGADATKILTAIQNAEMQIEQEKTVPAGHLYGDGRAADKIVAILAETYGTL
jgi:UDP-N-acetylglucosamine 2-epimerase